MILLRTLLFTILVPGTVVVGIPLLLLSHPRSPRGMDWLGLIPIVVGVLIYLRCAWDFIVTGRGTPNPLDPPRAFVGKGLYRFVRNPMYVGGLLFVLGEAAWFRSRSILLYGLSLWFFYHLFVTLYEEPHLRALFGEPYEEYRRQVPRWIPRIPKRSAT